MLYICAYVIAGSRDSSSIQSDTSRQSTNSPSNAFDVESVLSDAFGDIEFTEACALPMVSDDSVSTCPSTTSSQVVQVPPKKLLNSVSKWRPKW